MMNWVAGSWAYPRVPAGARRCAWAWAQSRACCRAALLPPAGTDPRRRIPVAATPGCSGPCCIGAGLSRLPKHQLFSFTHMNVTLTIQILNSRQIEGKGAWIQFLCKVPKGIVFYGSTCPSTSVGRTTLQWHPSSRRAQRLSAFPDLHRNLKTMVCA